MKVVFQKTAIDMYQFFYSNTYLNDEEQTMWFRYHTKHIFRKQPVKVDGVDCVDGCHGRVAKSS